MENKYYQYFMYYDFDQKPRNVRKLQCKARIWTISKYRVNEEPGKSRPRKPRTYIYIILKRLKVSRPYDFF